MAGRAPKFHIFTEFLLLFYFFILCIIPNSRQQTCGCTLLFIYSLTDYIDEDEQVRHNLSTYYYHFLL